MNKYDIAKINTRIISDAFIERVAKEYNLDVEDLKSTDRTYNILKIRMPIIVFLSERMRFTLSDIGEIFKRNHATIINSLRSHDSMLKSQYRDYSIYYHKITELLEDEMTASKTGNPFLYFLHQLEAIEKMITVLKNEVAETYTKHVDNERKNKNIPVINKSLPGGLLPLKE